MTKGENINKLQTVGTDLTTTCTDYYYHTDCEVDECCGYVEECDSTADPADDCTDPYDMDTTTETDVFDTSSSCTYY